MKWREFKKLAEGNGWVLKRHGNEHDIYANPNSPLERLVIERHWGQEIKPGLLKRLLKQVKGE